MKLPLSWDKPMNLDDLWFTFVRDADGRRVARVQGDTAQEALERAKTLCVSTNYVSEIVEQARLVDKTRGNAMRVARMMGMVSIAAELQKDLE